MASITFSPSRMTIFSSLTLFFTLVVALGNGCTGYSATGGPGPLVQKPLTSEILGKYDFSAVRDVAILPLEGEELRHQPVAVTDQLQQSLVETLALESDLEVRNLTEPKAVDEALTKLGATTLAARSSALNDILETDGVFYTRISKYKDSAKGERGPGEVAFRIWFIPRGFSSPVWSATYEMTEQPLSENLFRMKQAFKDGMSYRGAQKLLEDGFHQFAKAFEKLRATAPLKE